MLLKIPGRGVTRGCGGTNMPATHNSMDGWQLQRGQTGRRRAGLQDVGYRVYVEDLGDGVLRFFGPV